MTTQPEALRLADELDLYAAGDVHQRGIEQASDELRRLHEAHEWQYTMAGQRLRRIEKLEASNTELLAALKKAWLWHSNPQQWLDQAYAVINKAERTTT